MQSSLFKFLRQVFSLGLISEIDLHNRCWYRYHRQMIVLFSLGHYKEIVGPLPRRNFIQAKQRSCDES